MYAHRIIQPVKNLHVEIDLPAEFSGCAEAEIIVLPIMAPEVSGKSWKERVIALAGILDEDFPDDITDADLGEDIPREPLE